MDALYGKDGTPEREQFRREAYSYYMGQILHDARKSEKITQKELAMRVGVDKSYISKILHQKILRRVNSDIKSVFFPNYISTYKQFFL